MKVTIPRITEHAGCPGNAITVTISDSCPKCGAKRGIQIWKGFSYDGSRKLEVDCWLNECEHIDKYADVRREYLETIKLQNA